MTITYKTLYTGKDGLHAPVLKSLRITDVLRCETGKKGISIWKYDPVNKHELMYFISFDSIRNVCILP